MAIATSSSAPGGVPPHNEEAEASVLGAILMTEQALDGVLLEVGLRPDHFYRPRHQLVFQAMIRLKEKAEPEAVDALTVCDDLRSHGELENAGGEGYVHGLPAVVPAVGAVLDYARIVRDDALMRGILETTRQIQAEVLAHRGEPQELIERAETALFQIGHDTGKGEMRSLEEVLHDEMDKLVELSRKDVGLTGVTSGFADLDDVTGGFQAGNLIVLAARPSMGKSALAANIAENAAVEAGVPVAFFSLEMSETELAHRFLASRARVSSDELRKGKVRSDRWPKVNAAASKLAEAPLYIDDSSDLGVLELRAKARRLQNRHGLGLIIVDYLQLMRPDGRADSRVEQIGQMSRGLKILARELDVPVIAISQLSRAVESRNPPEPMLSDLRESGCLTGDSRVYLPESGEYRPIRELVGHSGFDVVAVNPATWKIERRRVTKAFATGSKPVLRLTTALGRTIRATGNHRFLAFDGWKHLDELAEGEHIALPRTLPGPAQATVPAMAAAGISAQAEPAGQAGLVIESDDLARLATSDVYWDRVVSVIPDGHEEVFDLTVDGLHNFVAEDIVVHNSIEQDADVVMFVYRDEYYNKETERLGEADLLVRKHRNGPIGDVTLSFLPKYPKFASLYRDREGIAPPQSDNGGG